MKKEKSLVGDQKKIDVAPPFGEITGADFSKLRKMETGGAADASDAAPFTLAEFATVTGTTITVNVPTAGQTIIGGTFMAIGRRS